MDTRTKGKLTCLILGLFLLIGVYFFFFYKKPLDLHAQALYVLSLDKEKKIRSDHGQEKRAPASLVKGMTTLVAMDKIKNLDERAPIDVNSYKEMVKENASMAGFYGREQVTYRDLIHGLLLASGGECARTLAIRLGGSEEAFVEEMNQKAKDLGLENTLFKNPTGMDQEGQVTTAEDMALLYQALFKDPRLSKVLQTKAYRSTKTLDHPEGKMVYSTVLTSLDEKEEGYVLGGKSGTTEKGGKSWAVLLKKGDKTYVVVLMGTDFHSKDYDQIREDLKKVYNSL